MSIFYLFKNKAVVESETEFVRIYGVSNNDIAYKIIVTKRKANNHTIIHCINNYIAWEQVPLIPKLFGRYYGDKIPIYKFSDEKDVVVFVISGKPNGITGLDDGVFRCANNFSKNHINVMSYGRFTEL